MLDKRQKVAHLTTSNCPVLLSFFQTSFDSSVHLLPLHSVSHPLVVHKSKQAASTADIRIKRKIPLFLMGVLYVTCKGLEQRRNQHYNCERRKKLSLCPPPSSPFTPLFSSYIPHVPSPPASLFPWFSSPEAPRFLSQSNPLLDMLPLCSATLTSRLVPLLRGQPRCARDNGMNAGMINPRGCWEKTQECVN